MEKKKKDILTDIFGKKRTMAVEFFRKKYVLISNICQKLSKQSFILFLFKIYEYESKI